LCFVPQEQVFNQLFAYRDEVVVSLCVFVRRFEVMWNRTQFLSSKRDEPDRTRAAARTILRLLLCRRPCRRLATKTYMSRTGHF
jgi:hypothetical protein